MVGYATLLLQRKNILKSKHLVFWTLSMVCNKCSGLCQSQLTRFNPTAGSPMDQIKGTLCALPFPIQINKKNQYKSNGWRIKQEDNDQNNGGVAAHQSFDPHKKRSFQV